MSKELTPLEALDNIKVSLAEYKEYAIEKLPTKTKQIREENDDDFDIIETALKEYEEIINTGWKNIPTNLQFLDKILDKYLPNSDTLKDLEKSLKALKIIKESGILVVDDYPEMLRGIGGIDLSDEESELLKEVLL